MSRIGLGRKGDVSVGMIIAIVLALAILVIVLTGVWSKYSFFVYIAKLLPGFNQTIPEGTSIVGVNLETDKLMYFTGEKWRDIDSQSANFVLGNYEFAPKGLKESLEDFYFDTKRKPERFNISLNEWRYWDVVRSSGIYENLVISPQIKNYFVNKPNVGPYEYIELSFMDNTPKYTDYGSNPSPLFAKIEYEKYPQAVAQIIAWRDGILEGNKCEKFLSLKIMEKGVLSSKNYTVRKVDGYIFVDLSKPVYDGTTEKWKDDCLGVKSYVDEDRSKWKNNVPVIFSYTRYLARPDVWEMLSYSAENGWSYKYLWQKSVEEVERVEEVYLNENPILVPYSYKVLANKGFYDGLTLLTKPDGVFEEYGIIFNYMGKLPGEGVFIGRGKTRVDVSFLGTKSEWGEWGDSKKNEELISKFIYEVLTEYNKRLLPVDTGEVQK